MGIQKKGSPGCMPGEPDPRLRGPLTLLFPRYISFWPAIIASRDLSWFWRAICLRA